MAKVGMASVFGAGVGMLTCSGAAFGHDAEGYYGPHMMWGGGWSGMFLGPLMMFVVLAAVIVALVLLIRWIGGIGHQAALPSSVRPALRILEERFARGEIDKDEFEERRRILGE